MIKEISIILMLAIPTYAQLQFGSGTNITATVMNANTIAAWVSTNNSDWHHYASNSIGRFVDGVTNTWSFVPWTYNGTNLVVGNTNCYVDAVTAHTNAVTREQLVHYVLKTASRYSYPLSTSTNLLALAEPWDYTAGNPACLAALDTENVGVAAGVTGTALSLPWTPSNITTVAWFDAADAATIQTNDAFRQVSQWNDKSGSTNHVTQVTGINQPESGTRTMNGFNVLDFDGGEFLTKAAFPMVASKISIFMVAEVDAIDNVADSLFSLNSLKDFQFEAYNTNQFDGNINCDGASNPQVPLTGGPFPGPSVYHVLVDTSGLRIDAFIDGTQRGDGTLIGGMAGSHTLALFADRGQTQFPNGAVAEVVIVSTATTAERQTIEGYLAHKWGIKANLPEDHPYKMFAPGAPIIRDRSSYANDAVANGAPIHVLPDRRYAGAWTPADMITTAWYDAADAATILASGSAVTNWLDKSGNSLHLSQSTGTNQPATGATINSLNAINFTDDTMATASNPFSPTVSNAFVIAVHKVDSIQMGTFFTLTGTAVDANRWQTHAPWSDGKLYFDCGGTVASNRVSAAYGVSAGSSALVSFYCSTVAAVQQIYKNGTLLIGDTSGHAAATVGNIAVGGLETSYQDTTLGEFIIINSTVDTATRQKLEGYLAHKWGLASSLPTNHVYKAAAPIK